MHSIWLLFIIRSLGFKGLTDEAIGAFADFEQNLEPNEYCDDNNGVLDNDNRNCDNDCSLDDDNVSLKRLKTAIRSI